MKDASTFIKRKLAELETVCKRQGIPLTIQRRTIMAALAARKDHPTADDIYMQIIDRLPGISKTTVYRVLETLVGLGVIRRISNAEAKSRFDADTSRHHHVQCMGCGVVVDIHDRALNNMSLPPTIPSGFLVIDYSINYTGVCPSCRGGSAPH